MSNLEEGLIEQHEDGYLQIKPGYPWQIISEPRDEFPYGSILYRIFRGWNERRLVAGLPLYWYGVNPNVSGSPSDDIPNTDFQFSEFSNPLIEDDPTFTLDDAQIYPGAVLQNVAFWNFLITEISLIENPDVFGEKINWFKYEYDGNYQGPQYNLIDANAMNQALGDQVSVGDIIATDQINRLLKGLWYLQFLSPNPFFYTESKIYPLPKLKVTDGNGISDDCATAYSEAINQWYSDTIELGVFTYNFEGLASGDSQFFGQYNFGTLGSSYTSSLHVQPAIPINGEFILIAQTYRIFNTGDYTDLSGITPSEGFWTVDRLNLQSGFQLNSNHFGFDITKPPFELFGINCSSFGVKSYGFRVYLFLKPQFADLPAPTP